MRLLIWDADHACPWESDKSLREAIHDYYDQFVNKEQVVIVKQRHPGDYYAGDITVWEVLSEAMWQRRKVWNRWCGDHQKVDEYEAGRDYYQLVHFDIEVIDRSAVGYANVEDAPYE